jgi:hypothetical protein
VLNGVLLGSLALGAVIALNYSEIPGLTRILADLPLAVAISAAVHMLQILFTSRGNNCRS